MYGATQPVQVSLALDGVTAGRVLAHLTLATTTKMSIEFSSGQEFDAAISDSAGKVVHRWGAGKMFAQMVHSLDVAPEKQWVVDVPVTPVLPPGKYSLQVWLLISGQPAKAYSASVPFEVTP